MEQGKNTSQPNLPAEPSKPGRSDRRGKREKRRSLTHRIIVRRGKTALVLMLVLLVALTASFVVPSDA